MKIKQNLGLIGSLVLIGFLGLSGCSKGGSISVDDNNTEARNPSGAETDGPACTQAADQDISLAVEACETGSRVDCNNAWRILNQNYPELNCFSRTQKSTFSSINTEMRLKRLNEESLQEPIRTDKQPIKNPPDQKKPPKQTSPSDKTGADSAGVCTPKTLGDLQGAYQACQQQSQDLTPCVQGLKKLLQIYPELNCMVKGQGQTTVEQVKGHIEQVEKEIARRAAAGGQPPAGETPPSNGSGAAEDGKTCAPQTMSDLQAAFRPCQQGGDPKACLQNLTLLLKKYPTLSCTIPGTDQSITAKEVQDLIEQLKAHLGENGEGGQKAPPAPNGEPGSGTGEDKVSCSPETLNDVAAANNICVSSSKPTQACLEALIALDQKYPKLNCITPDQVQLFHEILKDSIERVRAELAKGEKAPEGGGSNEPDQTVNPKSGAADSTGICTADAQQAVEAAAISCQKGDLENCKVNLEKLLEAYPELDCRHPKGAQNITAEMVRMSLDQVNKALEGKKDPVTDSSKTGALENGLCSPEAVKSFQDSSQICEVANQACLDALEAVKVKFPELSCMLQDRQGNKGEYSIEVIENYIEKVKAEMDATKKDDEPKDKATEEKAPQIEKRFLESFGQHTDFFSVTPDFSLNGIKSMDFLGWAKNKDL